MAGIIAALFTIFGIMGFGALTQKRGLFPPSMALCLNQFVYWVSLPCLLFTQMCTIPMDEGTRALIWGALAASMLCYALFYLFFSFGLRRVEPEATVRTLACTFPTAAFFGLPFIIMVFPGSNPSSDNSSVSIEPSSTVKTPIESLFKNSCFLFRTALYARCTGMSLSIILPEKNPPGKRKQSCLTNGKVLSPRSPFL